LWAGIYIFVKEEMRDTLEAEEEEEENEKGRRKSRYGSIFVLRRAGWKEG